MPASTVTAVTLMGLMHSLLYNSTNSTYTQYTYISNAYHRKNNYKIVFCV